MIDIQRLLLIRYVANPRTNLGDCQKRLEQRVLALEHRIASLEEINRVREDEEDLLDYYYK